MSLFIVYVCVCVCREREIGRPTLDLIESYKPVLYFIVTLY